MVFTAYKALGLTVVLRWALQSEFHLRTTVNAPLIVRIGARIRSVAHRSTPVTCRNRFLVVAHWHVFTAVVNESWNAASFEGHHCNVGCSEFSHIQNFAVDPLELASKGFRSFIVCDGDDTLAGFSG